MTILTYSPIDVHSSILGIGITGYTNGTFVKIEPDSPTFSYKRAMDGSVMVTRNPYAAYNVTITLDSTSPSNTWLHLLYKIFKTYGIKFKMPVMIRDKKGVTSFFSTDCWFDEEPPTEFSTSVVPVEWKLRCNDGTYIKGGNGDVAAVNNIFQSVATALAVANMAGIDLGGFEALLADSVSNSASNILGALF